MQIRTLETTNAHSRGTEIKREKRDIQTGKCISMEIVVFQCLELQLTFNPLFSFSFSFFAEESLNTSPFTFDDIFSGNYSARSPAFTWAGGKFSPVLSLTVLVCLSCLSVCMLALLNIYTQFLFQKPTSFIISMNTSICCCVMRIQEEKSCWLITLLL